MADEEVAVDFEWLEEELKALTIRSDKIDPKRKPTLLGTVLTNRNYSREGLKAFVRGVWKTKAKFQIEDIGQNLFLFLFANEEDLAMIMTGGPWLVKKYWLLLSPLSETMEMKDVVINESPVWIRINEVPPGSDKDDLIAQIGESFGGVFDYEFKGRQVRVKVVIDVCTQLRRGMPIDLEGDDSVWVQLQYENLPLFYFGCGRLAHEINECEFISDVEKNRPESSQP